MKFKLATEHTYWWPVKVEVPHPDSPGKWQAQTFQMKFVSMTDDEANAIADEIAALPTQKERDARQHDLLVANSRDWRDVVDDNDKELPFSQEALRQALSVVWYRTGIYSAYTRSLAGQEARRGN